MFEHIKAAPADPILGLGEAFKSETRENKINLGIGVYKDAQGSTPIMRAVKEAEKRLFDNEKTKNYLTIDGIADYNERTKELLFGKDSDVIKANRARTAQSLGGTGALRIAAEFIKRQTKAQNVWISTPTWPNHNAIFNAVGMTIREYRYYDAERKALDWEHLLEDLSQASEGDVVLLHGCCHNPTGIDPTPEQWQELATLSAKNGWLPLFDFAYQGLANGLDQDAYGLRAFAANHKELLVASSFSKNFGLYNERVGAFTLVAENAEIASTALTQVKSIIRTLYSNPASHGGATVATVLNDPQLRQEWENELTEMRERIKKMRHLFVQLLKEYGAEQDFSFIMEQNGMFSFSGLSPEQVDRLKEEFAIYAVRSLGIDPMTGEELFLTKEGKPTWIWNALDKIVVGDTEPKIRGTFGVNVGWKGLYMNATFAYQYGGEAYNQTVVDKVENSNKYQNVDKRVLTETWQKPGDVVKYKANVTSRLVQYFTYASSRFVQDLNYLQFSSFSLQYEMPKNWISCLRMESLRFSFNMSDLFYWSTVKRERGTSYPFARSFTVGLRANF